MRPSQLTADSFHSYSPKARQIAVGSLPLLQQLPPAFTPFLLKEIIGSEYKFPAELYELEAQLAYLNGMSAEQRNSEMKPFAALTLTPALESFDWVNSPAQFLEQLSAHLWATHQMDSFRSASEVYVHKFHSTLTPQPLPAARAGIIVIGEGVTENPTYPLFVKLSREGTRFNQVKTGDSLTLLHTALEERAATYPSPYSHWCLHGALAPSLKGFACVGYQQLQPVRSALASKMLSAYQAQHFDPEMLRTTLATSTYDTLGVRPSGDAALDQFSLSLLTEGSGTQIYSTTFVQWAAREALRRAQPLTLYAHYSPRQRERSMDELLGGSQTTAPKETDPMGSLIDADLGAYYTWLNQQRLPGAPQSRFLVWFQNHNEAVLISPDSKRAAVDNSPVEFDTLVRKVLLVPSGSTY